MRILLDVEGGLILSSNNPLGSHDKIWSLVLLAVLKYLCIGWNTKIFWVPSSSKWLLPRKYIESNVSNFVNTFSTSTCFVLF